MCGLTGRAYTAHFSWFFRSMYILEIKACAQAGYDRPESDALAKEVRQKDKMRKRLIDAMPVHQSVFPSSTDDLFPHYRYL